MKQTRGRESGRSTPAERRRRMVWATLWVLAGLALAGAAVVRTEDDWVRSTLAFLGAGTFGFGASWMVTLVRNRS